MTIFLILHSTLNNHENGILKTKTHLKITQIILLIKNYTCNKINFISIPIKIINSTFFKVSILKR